MLTLSLARGERAGRPPGAEGLQEIRRKLPTGALVTLSFDLPWSELRQAYRRVGRLRPARRRLLHQKQT